MKQAILFHLDDSFPWRDDILFLDCVDSTNTQAKRMAAVGAAQGTIVIANTQTGGRGRMNRSFHSPENAGIYLSLILRPCRPATDLMHLTCAAGIAACDAIESVTGLRPGIKWTNDLIWKGKKLGGILTELVFTDPKAPCAIIGIGINCAQSPQDFPEEIRDIATSVSIATGQNVDRYQLAAALIVELYRTANRLFSEKEALMTRYRADCITIGKHICVLNAGSVSHGVATGVDDDGGLTVCFSDGTRKTVTSGEVSIRGMYGYV